MKQQSLLDLLEMAKTPEQKAALIRAIADKDKAAAMQRFDLEKVLFKEQYEMMLSPAKRKVLVTSRRAGKSTFLAAYLLSEAMKAPRSVQVYVSLTKASAKRIIWAILTNFIEDYKLPFEVNNHELVIRGKNGSVIYVDGAHDQTSVERLRGLAIDNAVVDELQSFSASLARSLIVDIIDPSVTGTYGNIILAGTPCPIGKSALAIAWQRQAPFQDFVQFHWNVVSNIYLPIFVKGYCTPDNFLATIRKDKGYKETDCSYIREFLGLFVEDKDALVYGFDPDRDVCESLPPGHEWSYVISCDLGFNDSDAAVVGAFSYTHKTAYVVETFVADKQSFSEMAEKIQQLNAKYNPIMTIVDTGSGGLKFVSELNHRYNIQAKAAEKYNPKAGGCAMMADSFRKQEFKVLDNDSNQILIAQLSNITFITKTDKDGNVKRVVPDGKQVVTANGIIGDDAADACLYLFKACRNYLSTELVSYTPEQLQEKLLSDHKERVILADQKRIRDANKPKLWF